MSDILTDIVIGVVSVVISVAIICAILFGAYKVTTAYDDKLWNGGHCDICGGSWQYEQAVGHRSSTSYIYICPDCGKRIEIDEVR